jgi:uncharacterized protein
MPEYLAPGVYVEEVPSGNKPIEGVSTSTAGMVGVTQRGPVNDPTLVTSFPEFLRTFGGYLDHLEFTNERDALPYAVEGFFNNGGLRVYISRIVGQGATSSAVNLYGLPAEDAADTTLAGRAAAGGDTLLLDADADIESGTTLLIIDGPRSEYVTAEDGATAAGARLRGQLHFDHSGDAVAIQTVTEGDDLTGLISGDMTAGNDRLLVSDAAGLNDGDIIRVSDPDDPGVTEFVTISDTGSAEFDEPGLLFDHPSVSTELRRVAMADAAGEPGDRTVDGDAAAGSPVVRLTNTTGVADQVVRIGDGATREFQAAGNVVSELLIATTPAGARLLGHLHFDHAGDAVALQTVVDGTDLTPQINDAMAAGATALPLTDASALSAGDTLRISDTANPARTEYVTVTTDAQANITEPGLLFDHPQASTELHQVVLTDAAGEPGGRTVQGDAGAGVRTIPLSNLNNLVANAVVRVGDGDTREFQTIRNIVNIPPGPISALSNIHTAGTRVVSQVPLLQVHARHPGRWGNDLRVRVRRSRLLDTRVATAAGEGDSPIALDAVRGLSPGSVVEITTTNGIFRQRVSGVSTETNEIEFEGGVSADVQTGDPVSSIEFDLIVERIERGKVVETETIANLGMSPGHNRYALTTVGLFDTAAGRAERAGESELIRLSDLSGGVAERLLSNPFPNDDERLNLVSLYTPIGGSDDLPTIDDDEYIGASAVDPEDRSGIQSLENIDAISIVAVPGQTSQDVQNAIITHCTKMRYRFGVLDAPDRAKLRDVQTQRQNYDTTYAALYYPWMIIRDPFGRNGDVLSIPPSGHVSGIYARSDNQRGVHKAPANETLLGIRELQFRLTKGEQDILNPQHINCLRDFRDMNRGLRVWGARTLSSDPEWKYVNVRRLFQFVEKSIELATQFAVFEPNSEPLWATINRSVTRFLTAVWQSGALEGTKAEEAFFVKVDRTTMTQNDIDNGRLIILIGIAPVKPAEFVIFRISQKTREAVA